MTYNYQLKLPYKFEAFQLGTEIIIIHYVSEDCFTKTNNDINEEFIYDIEFDDEDKMYSFHKDMASMPYILDKK